jgi:hypothetical protein
MVYEYINIRILASHSIELRISYMESFLMVNVMRGANEKPEMKDKREIMRNFIKEKKLLLKSTGYETEFERQI